MEPIAKFNSDETKTMISLFKSTFRSVRHKTHEIKNDESLSYLERLEEVNKIERECVEKAIKKPNMNEEFILELHRLLTSFKENENDQRIAAYRELLSKYVYDDISEPLHFMDRLLFVEYKFAIIDPKYIINLYIKNTQ